MNSRPSRSTSDLTSARRRIQQFFNADPGVTASTEASLRTLPSPSRFDRIWDPYLLERLHSPLTRYVE